jgi:hypothetical protein
MEPQSSASPTQNPEVVPPAVAVTPSGPNVPTGDWPGAFGIFKHSKAAVMKNIGTVLILLVISLLVSAPGSPKDTSLLDLVLGIIRVFIGMTLIFAYLAGVRGENLSIGEAFRKALDPMLFLKFIGLMILVGLSVVVGLILLIVPGLILTGRLSLAQYYLIDRNMGVIEAYKASWNNTRGHAMKVWGIIGATIVMAVLILVLVGIYLLIMYAAAMAVLYEYINRSSTNTSPAPAPLPDTPATPAAPAH